MELGDLEAAVLGSVLRLNRASARQVVKDLEPSRGLAYSTISTTLDRLYKKGVLGRDEEVGRGGSRYIYMIRSEEKVKGRVVKGVVDRLLAAFGPSVLSTLNDYVEDIPKEELKRLEEKIQRGTKRYTWSFSAPIFSLQRHSVFLLPQLLSILSPMLSIPSRVMILLDGRSYCSLCSSPRSSLGHF